MYDFRVIRLILLAQFCFFLSGAVAPAENKVCEFFKIKLNQSIFYCDSNLIQSLPNVFNGCLSGISGGVICLKLACEDDNTETIFRFVRDGRQKKRHVELQTWVLESMPNADIHFNEGLLAAVEKNQKFLQGRSQETLVDGLVIKNSDLRNTSRRLKIDIKNKFLSSYKAYRLNGKDGRGNVQFTAYFTPVIKARRNADEEYRFALYKKPGLKLEQKLYPTRAEIDGQGVLLGQNLELAYIKNPFDAFTMQVQGSGLLVFEDGISKLLAFDSKNGHPYVSIGRLLVEDGHIAASQISLEAIGQWFEKNPNKLEYYLYQNPSYVFFKEKGQRPKGSTGISLIPLHSIAVDPEVIPYGSILLAKVPILNDKNQLSGHEWRLLFAHDTGSAIKGSGHVDLYMGIGDEAKRKASALHHYGEIWLLLNR
jgi:membrane-bound lytic murein transglycosylase A